MLLNYWLSTIHYAYAFIRIPCFSERCRSGFQPEADPPYGGNGAVSPARGGSLPDGWQAGVYGGKTVEFFGNNRRGARVVEWGGLENRCTVGYPGFESRPLRFNYLCYNKVTVAGGENLTRIPPGESLSLHFLIFTLGLT
jgi:hypothetical protein